MPDKKTLERATKDKQQGKAPSTQAGEFVREEMDHIREGKHGARSTKQAIALGLSKARRAGVDLPPPKAGTHRRKRARVRNATPPLANAAVPALAALPGGVRGGTEARAARGGVQARAIDARARRGEQTARCFGTLNCRPQGCPHARGRRQLRPPRPARPGRAGNGRAGVCGARSGKWRGRRAHGETFPRAALSTFRLVASQDHDPGVPVAAAALRGARARGARSHRCRTTTELHVPRGEIVFNGAIRQRASPRCLRSGRSSRSCPRRRGRRRWSRSSRPGSFGEALMFMDKPYIVMAQALSDSLLLHISKAVVFDELERDPAFARKMLAGLSRRLHGLIVDVEAYSMQSGTERVIGYLLRQDEDHAQANAPYSVTLPTSKAVVASRLNVTPEHFSRILHELTSED